MKFFRFALLGMVVILCLLFSCSIWEAAFDESAENENTGLETGQVEGIEDEEETEDVENPEEDLPEQEGPPESEILDETQIPEFLGFSAVSEREIIFEFSLPVRVLDLTFDPENEIEEIEEGSEVRIILADSFESGQLVEAGILIENDDGDSFNELIYFRAMNSRVPILVINELRTQFSGSALTSEFIEFKILSEGNLGGLRVYAESNYKNPLIYQFEPVEVEEGEYVVLHLRTLEDSCIDEYGDDLDESGGNDSSPTARDFWIPGSAKLLRKTDVVYVLDQDDNVLDAVMIAEKQDTFWEKDYFAAAAEFLYQKGAWVSAGDEIPGPADAVNSSGIGTVITRSISRDETSENTRSAADWYTTASKGATPGRENTPRGL